MHVDFRSVFLNAAGSQLWMTNDGAGATGLQANIVRWTWQPGTIPSSPTLLGHDGIRAWQAYFVGVPYKPGGQSTRTIIAGSQDNGAICSVDGGSTWQPLLIGGDRFAMALPGASAPTRAYALHNASTVLRSNDVLDSACNSISWTEHALPGSVSHPWSDNLIATRPGFPDSVYVALLSNRVAVSVDAGTSFTFTQTAPVTNDYNIGSLHVDGAGNLYAGTGPNNRLGSAPAGSGIYRLPAGGTEWEEFGLNVDSPAGVLAITSSSDQPPVFWAATTSGVYRRRPADGVWELKYASSGYVFSDVAIQPSCPDRVYVVQGFIAGRQSHRGGVIVTHDDGVNWDALSSGFVLHDGPVTDVEVDPIDPRFVYVATYGHGIWTYTWPVGDVPPC